MASSLETKLRIAGSVLFAPGFFDAIAGRFLFEPRHSPAPDEDFPNAPRYEDRAGAIHVHSNYSDGAGDVPTVMQGACAANVDFVFLTDHNTQRPKRDGWETHYSDRPLLLIGTEITVEDGAFLLAFDMPIAWEPTKHLKPQMTVDEVIQLGGLPLISLPFDVKHPWREWNITGCAGLEVVNLSTVARRHINFLSLIWLYAVHRSGGTAAAIRALLARPDAAMARWDRLTRDGKQSVGIGALDAHALMKVGRTKYPIPSYADSLGVVTTHVLLPPGVWHDAEAARAAIYEVFRTGRCYIGYDALGDPRPFSFLASNGTEVATMGEQITRKDGAVHLVARSKAGTLLRLYYQGKVVAAGRDSLHFVANQPGAYRVEGYLFGARLGPFYTGVRPWIFSNPIYVRD
jgi:hypothetical protein